MSERAKGMRWGVSVREAGHAVAAKRFAAALPPKETVVKLETKASLEAARLKSVIERMEDGVERLRKEGPVKASS